MTAILSFPKVPETKGEAETYLYLRTLGILKKSFWNFSKREVPYSIAVRDREPMPKTAEEAWLYLNKIDAGTIKLGFGSTMAQEKEHCYELIRQEIKKNEMAADAKIAGIDRLLSGDLDEYTKGIVLRTAARIMGVESITKHPTSDDK